MASKGDGMTPGDRQARLDGLRLVAEHAPPQKLVVDVCALRFLFAELGRVEREQDSVRLMLKGSQEDVDRMRAEAEALRRERDEAAAEAAKCVEFLQVQMGWEWFWADGWVGKDAEAKSQAKQNAIALRKFLDERGHTKRHVADLDAAREEIDRLKRDLDARGRNWDEDVREREEKISAARAREQRLREAMDRLAWRNLEAHVLDPDWTTDIHHFRAALAETPQPAPDTQGAKP